MLFRICFLLFISFVSSFSQPKTTYESDRKKMANDKLEEGLAENDSNKIALGYYELGKYDSGIENLLMSNSWFNKALSIYKKKTPSFELGKTYQWLAIIELRSKNAEKAIVYADSALKIFKKIKSPKGIISNYLFILDLNKEYSKKTPAFLLKDFDSMVAFVIKNNIKDELGYLYHLKGNVLKKSDPEAAIRSYFQAIYWLNKYGNGRIVYSVNSDMAYCYAKMGKPQKARQVLNDQKIYNQNPNQDQFYFAIVNRLKTEIEIFKSENDWKKAFEKQYEFTELQNKINVKEKSLLERTNNLDETALKINQEKELLLQSQLLKTNSNFFLLLYLVGAVFLISAFGFYHKSRRNNILAQKYLASSLKNELLIKEQSHRVKNNLQVISSLLGLQINRMKNSDLRESLEEMQGRIGVMSVLQQMFYSAPNSVNILIKDYFSLIVDKTEIVFKIKIEKIYTIQNIAIEPNLAIHLGIILNELLTNSFKYAFGFDNSNPKIQVLFSIFNGELTFEYKDNGKNETLLVFSKDYYATTSTFGLSLIRLKSNELNGNYHFEYENGLKFKLKCPYNEPKSTNS